MAAVPFASIATDISFIYGIDLVWESGSFLCGLPRSSVGDMIQVGNGNQSKASIFLR